MKHTGITSVKENQAPHFILGKLYYSLNKATDGSSRKAALHSCMRHTPHERHHLGKRHLLVHIILISQSEIMEI